MVSAKCVVLLVALNVMYVCAGPETLFRMSPDNYEVDEGIDTFNVFVVRDGKDIKAPVEIKYETKAGTATSGLDYVGISGVLYFFPGELRKTIPIQIVDDKHPEDTEKFTLHLIDIKDGELGAQKSSVISIFDNDKKPAA